MTRSFLLVCVLPTASHVWPSTSKSFTTEISGRPFSFFVYPEEETVCYRVCLLRSLVLRSDRRESSRGSLNEKPFWCLCLFTVRCWTRCLLCECVQCLWNSLKGWTHKIPRRGQATDTFSLLLFQRCWHPRRRVGESKV